MIPAIMVEEKINEDPKRSGTDDNRRDLSINLPKITRESTTEKQECDLQHRRQRLRHAAKVPRDNSVHFSLATLVAFDSRPPHVQ